MTDPNTAVLARIRQMIDAWEQRLPETISTATAVEALRMAMEPAAVEPPADQTAESVRAQLLHALDFSACLNAGYGGPEELLAAYDASRLPQPSDQAAPTPCTAYIENAHSYGRQHCVRLAEHTDSDAGPRTDHASPPIADAGCAGQAGRIYWDDTHVGAVPHQPDAPPTDQIALRDRIAEAALGAVEAALGDKLLPAAREEALAGIVAVPPPTDRAPTIPSQADTAAGDESPHVYMDAVQDSAAWAHAFTKAGQMTEALEHVEAIERLLAVYRRAVGVEAKTITAIVDPTPLDVLRCLADPEPCRWEGVYCITHSWKSDIGRCPHGQAQALLGGGR